MRLAVVFTTWKNLMKVGDLVRVKKKFGFYAVGIIVGTYDFESGSHYWRIRLGVGQDTIADPVDVELISEAG